MGEKEVSPWIKANEIELTSEYPVWHLSASVACTNVESVRHELLAE